MPMRGLVVLLACGVVGVAGIFHSPGAATSHPACITHGDFYDALLDDYDSHEPPSMYTGQPTNITVSSTIAKLNMIDTKTQTFRLNIYFRQMWTDPRLSWDPANACNGNAPEYIPDIHNEKTDEVVWLPDTFFATSNEISSPYNEEYVRVYSNGTVLWSKRVVITIFCHMDFVQYPIDEQVCRADIESYGHNTETLRYVLPADDQLFPGALEFLNENPNVGSVADFTIIHMSADTDTTVIARTRHSRLTYSWTFSRKASRFFVSGMSQLWLVVAMSFMGLVINPESAPARVAIALIAVLTCMNILNRLSTEIPVVPYLTGLDLMYLITASTVVLNVAEYAFINYLFTCVAHQEKECAARRARRVATKRALLSQTPTAETFATAKAELRGLFNLFAVDGVVGRAEAVALIVGAAGDRGRPVDRELVDHVVDTLPERITICDLCEVLLSDHPVAVQVGLYYEANSAICFLGRGLIRGDIHQIEELYRLFAPLLYIAASLTWTLSVLLGHPGVTWGIGGPLMIAIMICAYRTTAHRYKRDLDHLNYVERWASAPDACTDASSRLRRSSLIINTAGVRKDSSLPPQPG